MQLEFVDVGQEEIGADWEQFTGGSPVIGLLRQYEPRDVRSIAVRGEAGERGLLTWWRDGAVAEIVSLHADPPGRGIGTALMREVEARMQAEGVTQALVATTNDNRRAVSFYEALGYRLVRVHANAMDRIRALKPHVPLTGLDGIELRDLLELHKDLGQTSLDA